MSAPRLERWEELACDAALVGLDEQERAELEALAIDDAELLAFERAAGEIAAVALATVSPAPALPVAIAERVLARVGSPPREEVPPAREPRPRRTPPASNAWLPWAFAAAAAVVAVVGWTRGEKVVTITVPPKADPPAVDAGSVETPESMRAALAARPDTARLPWKATRDAAGANASGEVVWNGALQKGFMRFRGLGANDPAKTQYQLWIFDADRNDDAHPVDGGVFDVGPDGEVVVPIEAKLHVGKPKLFAVTVEKPGGVVVSKRERIVVTASPPG